MPLMVFTAGSLTGKRVEAEDDVLRLLVGGLPVENGFLGLSDIEALKADADRVCAEGVGAADANIHHYLLAIGSALWLSLELRLPLNVPINPVGSPAFNAELFREMSERMPRHEAFPELEGRSLALGALSSLCHAMANGRSEGDIVMKAIAAGLFVGGTGKVSEDDEAHQAGWLELRKRRQAEHVRLEKMRITKEGKDRLLLEFAIKARGEDPFIPKAAIERNFRAAKNPNKATRSNNVSKILARLEDDGLLPRRLPVQCDKPSGNEET